MTPLEARRAHDIGDVCDKLFAGIASGIAGFAEDTEEWLHPKGKSPTAPKRAGTPNPHSRPPTGESV